MSCGGPTSPPSPLLNRRAEAPPDGRQSVPPGEETGESALTVPAGPA